MGPCIYCKKDELNNFKGEEHVIPQSFGSYASGTPKLKNVCDGCNAYFGKELDQLLARDTIEGVTRYKKGRLSRESRRQKGMRFTLKDSSETGEWAGAVVDGIDGTTGNLRGPISQVHFLDKNTGKYKAIPIEKIKGLDWKGLGYSDKGLKIIAPSQDAYDRVVQELKTIGLNYKANEWLDPPPFLRNQGVTTLPVTIEGTIDKQRKRALAKILFNFVAYYLGQDEVLKPVWNKVREFIRNDGEDLLARKSQKPFWTGQETKRLRFMDDSINVRIENQLVKGHRHLVGVIQFYNLFTYEFILGEGYTLPPRNEIAYRFTPGQEPQRGIKMAKPASVQS